MNGAFPLALFAALLQLTATVVAPRGDSLRPHPLDWTATVLLAVAAWVVGAGWATPLVGAAWTWAAVTAMTAGPALRAYRASGGLIDGPAWVAATAMTGGYVIAALLRRITGLLPPWAAAGVGLAVGALVVMALYDRDAGHRGAGLPLQRGQRVGDRYVIQQLLAKGPRAVTFLARDRRQREAVVVKQFLRPGASTNATTTAEIEALEAIGHPNVVVLRDSFATAAGPCLVLEYVEGGDLAAAIKAHGPLDRKAFQRVANGLLSAIGAAHHAGRAHGDIKPANVLLTAEGQVKLTDFELSWDLQDATLVGPSSQQGTIRYLAPEVAAQQAPPGPAADLWGAAATLYEAYTGMPYVDVRDNEPQGQLRARVASLGAFGTHIEAPALNAWLARALAPSPAERFDNAADMAQSLLTALSAAPTSETMKAPFGVQQHGRPGASI